MRPWQRCVVEEPSSFSFRSDDEPMAGVPPAVVAGDVNALDGETVVEPLQEPPLALPVDAPGQQLGLHVVERTGRHLAPGLDGEDDEAAAGAAMSANTLAAIARLSRAARYVSRKSGRDQPDAARSSAGVWAAACSTSPAGVSASTARSRARWSSSARRTR